MVFNEVLMINPAAAGRSRALYVRLFQQYHSLLHNKKSAETYFFFISITKLIRFRKPSDEVINGGITRWRDQYVIMKLYI